MIDTIADQRAPSDAEEEILDEQEIPSETASEEDHPGGVSWIDDVDEDSREFGEETAEPASATVAADDEGGEEGGEAGGVEGGMTIPPEIIEQAATALGFSPQAQPQQGQQTAQAPAAVMSDATGASATLAPQEDPQLTALRQQAVNFPQTPETIAAFKSQYGDLIQGYSDAEIGERLSILAAYDDAQRKANPQAPIPEGEPLPPTEQAAKPYSLWDDVTGLPKAIASGGLKSGLETADFLYSPIQGQEAPLGEWRVGFEDYYKNLTGASSVAATIAQWGLGFVGVAKFAKLAGLARATTRAGQIGQAAAIGAGADVLAFDGHDARLSDLIQNNPLTGDALGNSVNGYLASDPNDSEAEGRFKNAIEGLGIGAVADVVFHGVKAMRARKAGDTATAEASSDAAIKRFEELNRSPTEELNKPPEALKGEMETPGEIPAGALQKPGDVAKGQSLPGDEPMPTGQAANENVAGSAPIEATPTQATTEPAGRPLLQLDDAKVSATADELIADLGDPLKALSIRGRHVSTPSTFDSLTHNGELRAILDATEKKILADVDGSFVARGVVPIEETEKLAQKFADDLSTRPEELFLRIGGDVNQMDKYHARLVAYDAIFRKAETELDGLLNMAAKKEPGAYGSMDSLMEAVYQRTGIVGQMHDLMKGARSAPGRALNALKYSREMNLDVTSLMKDPEQYIEMLRTAGDNRKNLILASKQPWSKKAMPILFTMFVRNILSGWKTHAKNIAGSMSATLAHPVHKIIGGGWQGDRQMMAEGMRQFGYMYSESYNAVRIAGQAFHQGKNFLDPSISKFTGAYHEDALSPEMLGLDPSSVLGRIAGAANYAHSAMSSRALNAEDEFFKQVAFASEIDARAWSRGTDRGLKGQDLSNYVSAERDKAFMDHPDFGKNHVDLEQADAAGALDVARKVTFTQPIKPGTVSHWMAQGQHQIPGFQFVVPFVRILSNLMRYTGNMTPMLGSRMREYKEAMSRGGRDAAVAQGQLAMGYALWTTAIGMAVSGQVTGPGPKDHKKRQLLEQSGWKPHSIAVGAVGQPGTVYIGLDGIEPFGMPFTIAADLAHEGTHKFDERAWSEITGAMIVALGQNVINRTYMTGLEQLFKAIGDNEGNVATSYVSNMASAIVVPNALRDINGSPYMQEAKGLVELLKRKSGIGELATRRMPWGEKMEVTSGMGSVHGDDVVVNEYARQIELGNKGQPEPLRRAKSIPGDKPLDMATFKLADGRLLYDAYGDMIQDPTAGMPATAGNSPPLKEALKTLITSEDYKKRLIDGPGNFRGTRLHAMRSLIGRYQQAAWRRILSENPEVVERTQGKKLSVQEKAAAQRKAIEAEAFMGEVE